jgi:hypothetical protein
MLDLRLKPFQQGGLDGLCGLYSVVNATRLAAWPVRRLTIHECESLFAVLVAELDRDDSLLGTLLNGTRRPVARLLRCADRWLTELHGLRLHYQRPFYRQHSVTNSTVARTIATHLAPLATAMIVLDGHYCHWSVVEAVTPTSLLLFDSDGLRRVRHRRLAKSSRIARRRTVMIVPQHVYLIRCEPM